MPDQYTSAVYHIAQPGRVLPALVHVEDQPDATADIYFHPLHVRSALVWDFNWVTRHQIGHGLWRQRWTDDGRMLQPAEGRCIAISRWEIIPARAMPRTTTVVPVEEHGSCIWLIKEGQCTTAMRDAMNQMLERIAGDGLWLQQWFDKRKLSSAPALPPVPFPPVVSLRA
jgi:hypothetical protein